MAPKLTPVDKIPAIVADWRTGEYSQRDLSERHRVSLGFVNKHTKGVIQDMNAAVNAGVQYKQALATADVNTVNAVMNAVDNKTAALVYFNDAAMENVKGAMMAGCENQQDFKHRADTILKGKEAVFGKQPETAIQINNSGAQSACTLIDVSDV